MFLKVVVEVRIEAKRSKRSGVVVEGTNGIMTIGIAMTMIMVIGSVDGHVAVVEGLNYGSVLMVAVAMGIMVSMSSMPVSVMGLIAVLVGITIALVMGLVPVMVLVLIAMLGGMFIPMIIGTVMSIALGMMSVSVMGCVSLVVIVAIMAVISVMNFTV